MQYNDVENYFKTNNFEGLLSDCNSIFVTILELSDKFTSDGSIDNPETVKEIMTKLSGCYNSLKLVEIVSDITKQKEELLYYTNRKREIETKGDKFVSASTEREASSHVMDYRRVRNIVEGYLDICEKTISVCQSLLKFAVEEAKLSKSN